MDYFFENHGTEDAISRAGRTAPCTAGCSADGKQDEEEGEEDEVDEETAKLIADWDESLFFQSLLLRVEDFFLCDPVRLIKAVQLRNGSLNSF